MRKFKGSEGASELGGKAEKLKLIGMSVALVLIVGAYAFNEMRTSPAAEEQSGDLPEIGIAKVEIPKPPPGLFDAIDDATEEARVLIEHDELDVLLAHVRSLTPTHYEASDMRTLDGDLAAELSSASSDHRGDILSVRGELIDLRERVAPSGMTHRAALLRTADERYVHVRSPRLADADLAIGDWARVDGLYFKQLADEDPSGTWVTGPLIVGSAIQRSYEDFGPVPEMERALLMGIADDGLDAPGSFPDLIRWRTLAWMRDMPEDAIDWAEAPELTGELMDRIVANGDDFRGQAFILPASRIQAMSRKMAGENPARLDHYFETWVGNSTWTRHTPMLFAISSPNTTEMVYGDLAQARLVFLKNMAYDTIDDVRRLVPVFAAYELKPYVPPDNSILMALGAVFIGLIVVIAGVILVLSRRDAASSKALQEKLVERRRARRATAAKA